MKIIFKHIVKNMYEKKLRTCIMLLTILLSTMVLFIGLSLNDIINHTYTTMTKGLYGDGNILITKETDQAHPLFATNDIETDSVDVKEQINIIQAGGESTFNDQDVKVSLIGLDVNKASHMNMIHPINTSSDFQLEENEAIISSRTASNYDLDIGDPVTIDVNNHTYTYSVAAISKTSGLYYSETEDMLLVVKTEHVQDIYETDHLVSQVLLKVNSEEIDNVTEILANKNSNFSVKPTSKLDTAKRDEETFQTAVVLAIVIIVMISAYVIFSLSKVIIQERMPNLGTFRSVGASKKMVNRMLRMEFLFYGIIGAVIGMILAMVLLPVAADSFNDYKEFGVKTIVTYNPVYFTIAFLFGALFPVIGGMVHMYRTRKVTLKELILQTPHTIQGKSKKNLFIGLLLAIVSFGLHLFNKQEGLLLAIGSVFILFIAIVLIMPTLLNGISTLTHTTLTNIHRGEIKLGIKNVANNKIVSNNVGMIIVVFLLLLMIGNTSAGIDQYIKHTVKRDFDVIMEESEMDFTTYEDIQMIDGVSDSSMQHISQTTYTIQGNQDTFIVYGVEDIDTFDQFHSGATFLLDAKKNFNQNENGIILDAYQAKRYDLSVGDQISLQPLDKDEQPLQDKEVIVEIVGTMEAASLTTNRDIILMPLPYYTSHFVDIFNQIEVKTEKSNQANIVKKNIENHYSNADLTVQTFDELLGAQKETVDTLIRGVLLIILLGLIIGLLGISNNLLVSFNERKKEYAVLYSVCMSRRQIIKMLVYEACMTFVSVLIIGLLAGFVMNIFWSRLLYAVGLRIQFSFNYELYFILSGAVLLLLMLSTYTVIRKVTRLNVLSELRYE